MEVLNVQSNDENLLKAWAITNLIFAQDLMVAETNNSRRLKMQKVVNEKNRLFSEVYPNDKAKLLVPSDRISIVIENTNEANKMDLLIETLFSNPFAPYELEVNENEKSRLFKDFTIAIGFVPTIADRMLKNKNDAIKAHRHIPWSKVAIRTVGVAAALAIGGYMAAPAIAGLIGSAAGLSGAAAVSFGLAFLGGGSLAAGGAGMAGGMWLVSGVFGGTGFLTSGVVQTILAMGVQSSKKELIKLMVKFKEMLCEDMLTQVEVDNFIERLKEDKIELERQFQNEKELNDDNSSRLKNIQQTLTAFEDTISWIEEEYKNFPFPVIIQPN